MTKTAHCMIEQPKLEAIYYFDAQPPLKKRKNSLGFDLSLPWDDPRRRQWPQWQWSQQLERTRKGGNMPKSWFFFKLWPLHDPTFLKVNIGYVNPKKLWGQKMATMPNSDVQL